MLTLTIASNSLSFNEVSKAYLTSCYTMMSKAFLKRNDVKPLNLLLWKSLEIKVRSTSIEGVCNYLVVN